MKSTQHNLLFIYPNQFGYHTDSYKYCEHLQFKYNISYVCFDQGYEKIELQNVKIYYLPYNIGKLNRLINFYKFIFKLTQKETVDIIFTVQFKLSFLIGLFAKSKIKILDFRTGDLNANKSIRFLNNLLMRFDAIFFSNISVISEGLRDILYLNKSKTLILPLGADIFSEKEHSYNRMDLLYVGHLHIRNIYQTIEGVALFLNNHKNATPKFSYTIIGFGEKNDEDLIRNLILKYELTNSVHFLGRKKYTELTQYFENCNIGVSYIPITQYFDKQPTTKTFEYINTGLFTIATNTYENRKVINNINGVLCNDDPESFSIALEKIYNNLHNIQEKDIRNSLQNYLWSNIVKNILDPYLISKYNASNKKLI